MVTRFLGTPLLALFLYTPIWTTLSSLKSIISYISTFSFFHTCQEHWNQSPLEFSAPLCHTILEGRLWEMATGVCCLTQNWSTNKAPWRDQLKSCSSRSLSIVKELIFWVPEHLSSIQTWVRNKGYLITGSCKYQFLSCNYPLVFLPH